MRQFRPADLLSLRAASGAAIAPGGDEFAYALRGPGSESALWRGFEGTEGLRPLTRGPQDRHPRYAPDGSQIAFLRGPEAAGQICLLDRRGGEALCFTRLRHGVRDFAWSPDGRSIAVIAPAGPEGPLPLPDGEVARPGTADARGALLLIQTDGTWRQLSADGVDCRHPVFSPSGRQIAVLATVPGAATPCLALVPADGGLLRCVVEAELRPGPAAFSPDGSHLAFVARPLGSAESSLFALRADGGEPVAYAGSLPGALSLTGEQPLVYAPDGRSLFALVRDGGIRRLAEVPARGDCRLRTPAGLDVASFALDETGSSMALVVEEPASPARFELRDAAGRLLLRSQHDHPALAGVHRTPPQSLALRGGCIATAYLPEGGAALAPVLITAHAPHAFSALAQLLAAQGLAAIVAPAGQLEEALAAAAAQFPRIDVLRFGVAADGLDALQDLALLARARAAAITNLPAALPAAVASDTAYGTSEGPSLLHLRAGDRSADHAAPLRITETRSFPSERGPACRWTAAAQAERLAAEAEWFGRYLAQ